MLLKRSSVFHIYVASSKSFSFHLLRMLSVQCPALFLSESGACVDDVVFEHVESTLVTELNCTEDHYA